MSETAGGPTAHADFPPPTPEATGQGPSRLVPDQPTGGLSAPLFGTSSRRGVVDRWVTGGLLLAALAALGSTFLPWVRLRIDGELWSEGTSGVYLTDRLEGAFPYGQVALLVATVLLALALREWHGRATRRTHAAIVAIGLGTAALALWSRDQLGAEVEATRFATAYGSGVTLVAGLLAAGLSAVALVRGQGPVGDGPDRYPVDRAGLGVVLAGLLAVLATFLPWTEAEGLPGSPTSVTSGLAAHEAVLAGEGSHVNWGRVLLAAGFVAVVAGMRVIDRRTTGLAHGMALGAGLTILGVTLWAQRALTQRNDQVEALLLQEPGTALPPPTLAYGIWVAAVVGALMAAVALLSLARRSHLARR